MTEEFKWLHLTDLHVGQNSMNWLWPNFKRVFLDDLERKYKDLDGIDLVIFSGDLTQKGSVIEYDTLNSLLSELYENFDRWGGSPSFFSVPGNHDLVRPDPDEPESVLFNRWWDEESIRKIFWKSKENSYRKHLEKAFENYESWFEGLSKIGVNIPENIRGAIPGDRSAKLKIGELSVGLIGLNSSFLQMGEGNFEGKLALDVRQLSAVTGNDADEWCSDNEINFLITHHPSTWLEKDSAKTFNEEISPPGRFTAHLYGHMHEASSISTSLGGGPSRKNIQGPSIFGLESYQDGSSKRLHGYSLGRIKVEDNIAEWRYWPRMSRVRSDGARQMIPDFDFAIVPGQEYVRENLEISFNDGATAIRRIDDTSSILSFTASNPSTSDLSILARAQVSLHGLNQHMSVRVASQQACIASLSLERMVWLCTDWGLGTDGFIFSVTNAISRQNSVYKIDLSNYNDREEFLTTFPEKNGCSFPEFCKYMLSVGPSIILFDEAPSDNEVLVKDVESLGQMVLDFCPQVSVLAITRIPPVASKLSYISLIPLDEPDTRAYVFSHQEASEEIKNPNGITEIFRLTEGVPNKIERVLKSLRVVSLAELANARTDGNEKISKSREGIPRALSRAVSAILDSIDPNAQRTALMLKLLCILPHGETLQKIKRFDSQKIFYTQHAEELLDLALIEVKSTVGVMSTGAGGKSQIKLLSVRGPVRDYVQSLLSERELDALTKKAMALYFEQQRVSGIWRIRGRDGVSVSEDVTTLDNGHELTLNSLGKAVALGQISRMKNCLLLAQVYCGELFSGRHYRSCASACDGVLGAIHTRSAEFQKEMWAIKYLRAKSVRMLADHERARSLLEELRSHEWPKEFKVSILLNYALCLQSLGDNSAISVAKELISLSPKSNSAIQARAIVIEMIDGENSDSQLLSLENDAKKKGAITVRNNLVLSRANSTSPNDEMAKILHEVRDSSLKQNDPYNAGRAAVKIASIELLNQKLVKGETLSLLVSSYQYFYGQRFDGLFNDAHKALWEVFEKRNDLTNLLSLFKYSSFIWRLGGKEERESIYIKKLIKAAANVLTIDLRTADQDAAYFVARARQIAN